MGQHVGLRFNGIPPPPAPTAWASATADSIKDGVLSQLEAIAPAMWMDPAFALPVGRSENVQQEKVRSVLLVSPSSAMLFTCAYNAGT